MLVIAMKELKEMLKSFKALFIIGLFVVTSYFMSRYVSKNFGILDAGINDYASAIRLLVYVFGFLFVLMLSHDVVSRETSTKTIRFLLTKTSRANIIWGKFFGISAFWFLSLGVSFSIVSIFAGEFLWMIFLQLFGFLIYIIGLCVFVSTIAKTPSVSMLISLALSFVLPIMGLWSMFSENNWLKLVKFFLPYQYQLEVNMFLLLPFIIGILFAATSILLFKRGDY